MLQEERTRYPELKRARLQGEIGVVERRTHILQEIPRRVHPVPLDEHVGIREAVARIKSLVHYVRKDGFAEFLRLTIVIEVVF
jgi:hypothetical protein